MKGLRMLVFVALVGGLTASAWGQDSPVQAQRKAQAKVMAARAARVDAIRKLGERINGLHITSETFVKDFVAESDSIKTALSAFIRGAREKGDPKFMEDGTCEVTMEVTLEEVIVDLKQISNRYYKGDKFKGEDFEKMTVTNKLTVLTETGMGAPREIPADDSSPVTAGTSYQSLTLMSAAAKAYWLQNVKPQGRLMAVQAARVDAQRRLAERIKGVAITSSTTVQDFVAQSDEINVNMETFLVGAREVSVKYHADEPVAEVTMEVTLRTIYATLKSWGQTHFKGDQVQIKALEELTIRSEDTPIRETGMGIPREDLMVGGGAADLKAVAIVATAPPWISQKIKAVGQAAIDAENPNKAQAKLMALKAAEVDARRKIAEQINGLMITSSTSVKDFIAQSDEIATELSAYQRGAHRLDNLDKVNADGTVEATVELDLKDLWDTIIVFEKKLHIEIK